MDLSGRDRLTRKETEMTKENESKINELKAFAYDLLAQIDWAREQLKVTNLKIVELSKPAPSSTELKAVS